MNPETKTKLIGLYLKRLFPQQYQSSWLHHMENYLYLGKAIEYLHINGPDFLDLDKLDDNKAEFGLFCNILCAAITLSDTLPPVSTAYNPQHLEARCEAETRIWTQFPNADYTSRKTIFLSDTHDGELQELKKGAIQVLVATTLKSCLSALTLLSQSDLTSVIDNHAELYARETRDTQKARLKAELGLLKNIYKIIKLELIDIPDESAGSCLYCTVDESVGGVTEKISLMPLTAVKEKLRNIVRNSGLDFNKYLACVSDYEVLPQGILKLPKHGFKVEAQREAIALNIARILGFTTTKSTMVQHDGKPALFIPFDTIQLMGEFAKGEQQTIFIPNAFSLEAFSRIGDSYLNHSTIVPVGNQLHADRMLEDFGYSLAFAWLCNDTDFIGGSNQNKGIIDGKALYLFDQVVMSEDKMELDTRLGLLPVGVGKYFRHNEGRNKSIIEDSSFASKLDSIAHLLASREHIGMMINHMVLFHQARRSGIHGMEQQEQQATLEILEHDAIMIGDILCARMQAIFKHFPSFNDQPMDSAVFLTNKDLIKQCLLLEKLLNKPVLFADDGRPYKHPWTDRHIAVIKTIKLQGEQVSLGLDTFEIKQLFCVLRACGIFPDTCRVSMGNIIIPLLELNKINETRMFPEYGGFSSKIDYLDVSNLAYSEGVYPPEMQDKANLILNQYRSKLALKKTPKDKIITMTSAIQAIQKLSAEELNKAFYKHLELKLQFDVYQQLLILISNICPDYPAISDLMLQAMDAAIKLDRVNNLTQVLCAFVCKPLEQNRVVVMKYLCNCIENAVIATDYNQAKIHSNTLERQSSEICQCLVGVENDSPRLMVHQLGGSASILQQRCDHVDGVGEQYQTLFAQKTEIEKTGQEQLLVYRFW